MQSVSPRAKSAAAPDLEASLLAYRSLLSQDLKLNMARGVPSAEQLSLSDALLGLPGPDDYRAADGTDCRNYMGQQGLPEARRLFAGVLGVPPENVVVEGNSSLALMHDCLAYACRAGVPDGDGPWQDVAGGIAFLCPVPGYDRHFKLCEAFGIRMIPVPLREDGPDLEMVRALVAQDRSIRGIWCVPKYSNPTGTVYSDEVIKALASMPAAAPDFRIFWDNAYALHHLGETEVEIANLAELCVAHGHANRALIFASTSKITYAGAGLGQFGSSTQNVAWYLRHASFRSVGPDKINQLRHVRFLKDEQGLKALMRQHRAILAPRFACVIETFESLLGDCDQVSWTTPSGGYFITLNVVPGTARRVVELCHNAGVMLTEAGAPFPGGVDPEDRTLRIAPSSPSLDQIGKAAHAIAVCTRFAAAEKVHGEVLLV
ncbi:aminotransferase class I/II-fold pyridoxal phosphate-dependent enzyme [Cupriavidus sp. TMH.W2]|uniref:aminotransferase class I/II-fold pyridoxal phosphate-dependent enzyme n=1 Tax=Cupriavidus sp. TMH.W2 TaxID=3434465 RepID=UPI003D775B89